MGVHREKKNHILAVPTFHQWIRWIFFADEISSREKKRNQKKIIENRLSSTTTFDSIGGFWSRYGLRRGIKRLWDEKKQHREREREREHNDDNFFFPKPEMKTSRGVPKWMAPTAARGRAGEKRKKKLRGKQTRSNKEKKGKKNQRKQDHREKLKKREISGAISVEWTGRVG